MENPKKYPDFDFKPLKNTQIAIFRAILRAVSGKMASIFQKFNCQSIFVNNLDLSNFLLESGLSYFDFHLSVSCWSISVVSAAGCHCFDFYFPAKILSDKT